MPKFTKEMVIGEFIGDCPYTDCKGMIWAPLMEGMPIEKRVCEACSRIFWTLHSRVAAKSWTEEAFKEIADVDEETNAINFKDKTKSIYDF